jgi:rubrerythrin
MSNDTETVGKLFDYAIELEKASETLYRQMGKMFSHTPEIVQYWEHYADEERGHASYLENIRKGMDTERLSLPADSKIIADARKCLGTVSQKRLDSIQNLEDAHQLAIELEIMITIFSADDLTKSRKFIRTQLSSHIARLDTELPVQFRSRVARQNLPASK